MQSIEQLLREAIGLDAASIGSGMIQRSVRLRMKGLGLKDLEPYRQLLLASPAELRELVESVVVTETWFFRDQEPFAIFTRLVTEEWLPARRAGRLRVLSAPCSSGEEPYSLAMSLLDAGLRQDRFHIDAADVSSRALERAKRAVYGKNSFRGKDLRFRDRHFFATKDGFALSPAVRDCVRFFQVNLLDDSFVSGRAPYDFIFCRNLLIYFDRPTQAKVLGVIERLLTPAGVLFVGPAEQPLALDYGFLPAHLPMAFACRRPDFACLRPEPKARPARASRSLPPLPRALAKAPAQRTAWTPDNSQQPAATRTAARPPTDLEVARRLADAGRLAEAAAFCEKHLAQHGASAQAYYLLGLIKDAANDAAAAECYRKALYLDPHHYETLVQMALWAQKNGDLTRARTLRTRAERAKQMMS